MHNQKKYKCCSCYKQFDTKVGSHFKSESTDYNGVTSTYYCNGWVIENENYKSTVSFDEIKNEYEKGLKDGK